MNYYNEITKKVKDYSKNKSDLTTYYNVGKLLSEAGKHYGEGIIKEYSNKLSKELNKKYSITTLSYMKQFYESGIFQPLVGKLTWSHYLQLLSLKFKKVRQCRTNRYEITIQNLI